MISNLILPIMMLTVHFFSRKFPARVSTIFLGSMYLGLGINAYLSSDTVGFVSLFNWISFVNYSESFNLFFNETSWIMTSLVYIVSGCVHFFASSYLATDSRLRYFSTILSIFTLSMLILVLASNLLVLILGWEGVGITSYLLISFWNTRVQAVKSALKAVFINRIGDVFIFLLFVLCLKNFSVTDVFFLDPQFIYSSVLLYCSLLTAAFAKSAQFGLHTWLPDAMEGPTPVSALLHAATMVTAGVYLIIQFRYVLLESSTALLSLQFIGSLTAFLAGTIASVQVDLKKIIAYSTCSQLGLMFVACGSTSFNNAFFHLYTHAFFKALLFITAGYVIHSLRGEQDLRQMGGLIEFKPILFVFSTIASLSLVGFPLFAGFFSKENIVLNLSLFSDGISQFSWYLVLCAIFCTTYYSTKLSYFVFFGKSKTSQIVLYDFASEIWSMTPLVVLSFLAAYIYNSNMIGSLFLGYSFTVHYSVHNLVLLMVIWGAMSALVACTRRVSLRYSISIFYSGYIYFKLRWFFDSAYALASFYLFFISDVVFFSYERGLLELSWKFFQFKF